MNIGISTSVIQRGQTGIAQYVFGLVRALARYANEHQFFLFVLEEDLPLFDFVADKMEIVVVPEKFRPPLKNIFWHQFKLPKLIREKKIDVLHVPSYRRLLWRQPCATVATIHDLAPFTLEKKYDWARMFYGRVVVKHLARRQKQIIAISRNTAWDIDQYFGIPREKIEVVHNGIDHETFLPGPAEAAKTFCAKRFDLRGPFFLYVARLEHPAKNHVRLIDAFNHFKAETKSNWQLALGGSDWNGAEEIHRAAGESPFASDIRFLGFVGAQELPELYRAAEIFVYPSLYEGFGMPPIEAMACGCPVIASSRGALGEVLGRAAEIIDPENSATIYTAMKKLSADEPLRGRLRHAGLIRSQNFHWQYAAAKTMEIYLRAALANVSFELPANLGVSR